MVAQVLVIEDNAELGEEIRDALARRGFDCQSCGSILQAERAVQSRRPDFIVSDVFLPDGNGVAFLHQHRSALPHTKWLLMSGNRHLDKESLGAAGFTIFDKPVAWQTLIGFIRDGRKDWSN